MIRSDPTFNYLEIDDFRIIAEQLISAQQEYSEDLPPFNTRYPERLEAIINQVQSNYFGEELYKDFPTKAAMLFYLLNKDHPFINGNKRISIVALYEFLERNTSELYISEEALSNDLYEMAIVTAASSPDKIDETVNYLKEKIQSFILSY